MALLPLVFATPAQAATDQVDQKLVLNSWLGNQNGVAYMAQTFTAVVSGQVDKVSLPVNTTGWGMFTVSLAGVASDGTPTANVLGTGPTNSGSFTCCGLHDFGLPDVGVIGGVQYAIVVHPLAGSVRWMDAGTADIYTAGRQFIGGSPSSWVTTSHPNFGFEEWVVGGQAAINQAPVVKATTPALTMPEGTAPKNSGTCSDPDGDTVSLKASSGTVSSCTAGAWTWTEPAPDAGPTQAVTVTADDGRGMTNTTSFTVHVFSIAPVVSIDSVSGSVPLVTTAAETLSFHGSFTDADSDDKFTITWTFGDGATATGADVTHSYAAAGKYPVELQVSDGENAMGTADTSVTVQTTQQALTTIAAYVQTLSGLNNGERQSLIAKLNAAEDSEARGNEIAAFNQLDAFLNELHADVDTGKVSPDQAATLFGAVHAVQAGLGTFGKLLSWRPLLTA